MNLSRKQRKSTPQNKKKGARQHIRASIKLDPIHPRDFREMEMIYACEQCAHFDPLSETCTLGYNASNHRQVTQLKLFELTGKMALCRFIEID